LLQASLERAMAGLDVAILLLRPHRGGPRLHPEVPHHRRVFGVERTVNRVAGDLVRRGRRVVGLVEARHPPQLKQRRLHASS
jgi:hypothetical protein